MLGGARTIDLLAQIASTIRQALDPVLLPTVEAGRMRRTSDWEVGAGNRVRSKLASRSIGGDCRGRGAANTGIGITEKGLGAVPCLHRTVKRLLVPHLSVVFARRTGEPGVASGQVLDWRKVMS